MSVATIFCIGLPNCPRNFLQLQNVHHFGYKNLQLLEKKNATVNYPRFIIKVRRNYCNYNYIIILQQVILVQSATPVRTHVLLIRYNYSTVNYNYLSLTQYHELHCSLKCCPTLYSTPFMIHGSRTANI